MMHRSLSWSQFELEEARILKLSLLAIWLIGAGLGLLAVG